MQRLIILLVLATAALGDVSHLFKPSHNFVPPSAPKQAFLRPPAAPVKAALSATVHESKGPEIAVVRQNLETHEDGSYQWAYETANGIVAHEEASVKEVQPGQFVKLAHGSFQYTDLDGTPFALSYSADENGFHATGEHLPTAPPVPAAIVRALEYRAAHPEIREKYT